jgi:hypothetical protein
MNSYYTRSQKQILESTPNYNTRLQTRIRDLIHDKVNENNQTTRSSIREELSKEVSNISYSIENNVHIDFDEASREWNKNKRRVGQSYEYVGGLTTRSGGFYQKKP